MAQVNGPNGVAVPEKRAEGYDRLGLIMGMVPEMTILRRFGALSAEDLLYRQAELVELERSLREYQKEDKESDNDDRQRYALNWDTLRRSADDDAAEGNDGNQWETILEIREKLKDYRAFFFLSQIQGFLSLRADLLVPSDDALLRHQRMLEVPQPLSSQVKALDQWMQRPTMGYVYLSGSDSKIWMKPNVEDMITLAPKLPEDGFVTGFTTKLIEWYNKLLGRHIHVTHNPPLRSPLVDKC